MVPTPLHFMHPCRTRHSAPVPASGLGVLPYRRALSILHYFDKSVRLSILDFNFAPGAHVLVRNSNVEASLGRKTEYTFLTPFRRFRLLSYYRVQAPAVPQRDRAGNLPTYLPSTRG